MYTKAEPPTLKEFIDRRVIEIGITYHDVLKGSQDDRLRLAVEGERGLTLFSTQWISERLELHESVLEDIELNHLRYRCYGRFNVEA